MEPSSLDNNRHQQEHGLESRTRVLEVKVSVQEQKTDDGFTLLRTEMQDGFTLLKTKMEDGFTILNSKMDDGFALLRAEMAQRFAEEARARAELELRLKAEIETRTARLEAKFDAQFRLLLRMQVATFALLTGLALKLLFWR
jgi:hypothetical protein